LIHAGKVNVLGVLFDVVDYEGAIEHIVNAAKEGRSASVSALAVHGLMTGVLDREQKYRLNHLSLVVPDGQPVRWAMNLLHGAGLKDRVYGPNLTRYLCARAEKEGLPVYFYGSTPSVLEGLRKTVRKLWPNLVIAGLEPSKFRRLTPEEKADLAGRIRASGAKVAFIGLGCPRQEVFGFEFQDVLPIPILAVGAAFPFLAGELPQAPPWMQRSGLEWLFRLSTEPRRLFRRYVFLNPAYLTLLMLQATGLRSFDTIGNAPSSELLYG
jgi:N-acetylglucosaminyldiphosphoundecaprenol N-acetyl-beta-D-mannosaminyltransferase